MKFDGDIALPDGVYGSPGEFLIHHPIPNCEVPEPTTSLKAGYVAWKLAFLLHSLSEAEDEPPWIPGLEETIVTPRWQNAILLHLNVFGELVALHRIPSPRYAI